MVGIRDGAFFVRGASGITGGSAYVRRRENERSPCPLEHMVGRDVRFAIYSARNVPQDLRRYHSAEESVVIVRQPTGSGH